jgi:hypothetical protein
LLKPNGKLLFSFVTSIFLIAGNHYGTPKPSKEASTSLIRSPGPGNNHFSPSSPSTTSNGGLVNIPGAHPSSDGKRKRNRSNVEAMTAKHFLNEDDDEKNNSNQRQQNGSAKKDLNEINDTTLDDHQEKGNGESFIISFRSNSSSQ